MPSDCKNALRALFPAAFLFFLERKTGRLAREAQALRRTDAGTSCVVVGRNTAAGMPPSSALSLPVSAAPARQLSRANRPRKRKSIAEQLSFCSFVAFVNTMHKTDGSYVNRPFFRFKLDVRKSIFSPKNTLPRNVFCFFSSRKEIVPPSFLFRRKEAKENRLRESCFSVLLPFSITCNTKRTVHIRTVRFSVSSRMCGKASFLRKTPSPAMSFVSFLQEKKSYPLLFFLEEKKQKKVVCEKAFLRRACCFHRHAAQRTL